ncbi:MAG: pilus assembly protein [Methylobacter sp.]|nr:pilus assembly protein [Methylobacter sp.]
MKLKCTQKGTSTVEFAMILPFLLIIFFGIMEFGILLYDKAVITNASREAARSGIAFKSPKLSNSAIKQVAVDYAGNYLISSSSVKLSSADINVLPATPLSVATISGTPLTVGITYPYTFFVFGNLFNAYMNGSFTDNQIILSATTVMNHE